MCRLSVRTASTRPTGPLPSGDTQTAVQCGEPQNPRGHGDVDLFPKSIYLLHAVHYCFVHPGFDAADRSLSTRPGPQRVDHGLQQLEYLLSSSSGLTTPCI
jgi:hypothetical protein